MDCDARTMRLSITFQQLLRIDIILDLSPGKTTFTFLNGFETCKKHPGWWSKELDRFVFINMMRKAFRSCTGIGPPVCWRDGKGLFSSNILKLVCFCGQGMDKNRLHPLARGAYYIGLYVENFLGDRSRLFRARSRLSFCELRTRFPLNLFCFPQNSLCIKWDVFLSK